MTTTLPENREYEFRFTIPSDKTVPHFYPEASEFQQIPPVFATGFMVGLCEWACMRAINKHIDWPATQTVGTHLPGLSATVKVKLLEQQGRKLTFAIIAHDGIDSITEGTHERMIVDVARFSERLKQKAPSP